MFALIYLVVMYFVFMARLLLWSAKILIAWGMLMLTIASAGKIRFSRYTWYMMLRF